MTHHGWIYGVGGYIGGILTTFYGHVGKYSLDRANELKELIGKIRQSISDFEAQRVWGGVIVSYGSAGKDGSITLGGGVSNMANPAFCEYPRELMAKLELIPWYWYFFIRMLLVRLPPKRKIRKAAEDLPKLACVALPLRQDDLSIAKKVTDLLK